MAHQESRLQPPTEAVLRDRLGPAFEVYLAFLATHPELRPEWKWYGQNSGWSLKLLDGKRNLCVMSPRENRFVAAFMFGHDAVNRALEDEALPAEVKRGIAEAPTYPEGRGFSLEVDSDALLPVLDQLLELKRGPKPTTTPQARSAQGQPPTRPAPRPQTAPRADRRMPSHRRGRS